MEDVTSLKAIIVTLLEKIAVLEARLEKYEHPKNSRNSSLPPSKDENRPLPNQSLRIKTDKKIGGQPGHKGHTLEMSSTPTQTTVLKVGTCQRCGRNLRDQKPSKVERRQLIDIPTVGPIIEEFQSYSTICSCGHCNKAIFPQGLDAPVQYGSSVESLIVYLHTRQYMPFNRMKEHFSSVYQIQISEGTIQNVLKRMAERALPIYNQIKATMGDAKYLGGDETSVRINGKKGWFWTLQNGQYTLIHCADNRGYKTLDGLFPKGLPNTILVHDAYSAWFKLLAKGHQLCLAHLLRDINFFDEVYKSEWVTHLKTLFRDAIHQKHNGHLPPQDFKSKLNILLLTPPQSHILLQPFIKRLVRYSESLFNFLEYDFVPADNNASERAIRNAKIKTKVSGQFKSLENAQIFAILRSVVDTLNKKNQPILASLQSLANFRPE